MTHHLRKKKEIALAPCQADQFDPIAMDTTVSKALSYMYLASNSSMRKGA